MDRGSLLKSLVAFSLQSEPVRGRSSNELETPQRQSSQFVLDTMLLGASPSSGTLRCTCSTPSPVSSAQFQPWISAMGLLTLVKASHSPLNSRSKRSDATLSVKSTLQQVHAAISQEPSGRLRWQCALAVSASALQLQPRDADGALRRAYRGAVLEAARDVGGQWATVLALLSQTQWQHRRLCDSPPSSCPTPMLDGTSIRKLKSLRNGIGKQWRDALEFGIIVRSHKIDTGTKNTDDSSGKLTTTKPAPTGPHSTYAERLRPLHVALNGNPPPSSDDVAKALVLLMQHEEHADKLAAGKHSAATSSRSSLSKADVVLLEDALRRVASDLQHRNVADRTSSDTDDSLQRGDILFCLMQQLAQQLMKSHSSSALVSNHIMSSIASSERLRSMSWCRPLQLLVCDNWLSDMVCTTTDAAHDASSSTAVSFLLKIADVLDAAAYLSRHHRHHDDDVDRLYVRWLSSASHVLLISQSASPQAAELTTPSSRPFGSPRDRVGILTALASCCWEPQDGETQLRTQRRMKAAVMLATSSELTPRDFITMPLACRPPYAVWVAWLDAHMQALSVSGQFVQRDTILERILCLLGFAVHAYPRQLVQCPRFATVVGAMPCSKEMSQYPQQLQRWQAVVVTLSEIVVTPLHSGRINQGARNSPLQCCSAAVASAILFQQRRSISACKLDWKRAHQLFHLACPSASVSSMLPADQRVATTAREYHSLTALADSALYCVLLLAVNKVPAIRRVKAGNAIRRKLQSPDSTTAMTPNSTLHLIHALISLFDRHCRAVDCSLRSPLRCAPMFSDEDHNQATHVFKACDAFLSSASSNKDTDAVMISLVKDVRSTHTSGVDAPRLKALSWGDVIPCAFSFEERDSLGIHAKQRELSQRTMVNTNAVCDEDAMDAVPRDGLSMSFLTLSASLSVLRSDSARHR
jgi:hypothetical protein